MVRTAHDVGHAHVGIVHAAGEGVKHLPIRADQHGIADRGRVDRDVAQDAVGPFDPLMLQQEAPVTLAPLGPQAILVRIRQRQAGAVIDRGPAHVQQLLALEIQFGRGLEHLVKPALGLQRLGLGAVAVQPQGLTLDPVPMQAQPVEIALDALDIFLARALPVGIVKPQDEGSAGLPGDQIVEQRGAQVAHMNVAGGRWRETGDGHGASPVGIALSQATVFVHIRG